MCPVTYTIMGNNHPVLKLFVQHRTMLNTKIFQNHEMIVGLVACCADVQTMSILEGACISGPALTPETVKAYWKAFEFRKTYFIGARDSIEAEKTAFQALLDSIMPLNSTHPLMSKCTQLHVPGAFPADDDNEQAT